MICLYCSGNLAVANSRPQLSRNQTWRRRLCKVCGAVFTSIESVDLSQALVVQNNGQRGASSKSSDIKPFDRDQLFISIYESLRHRPSAAHDARGLTDTITAQLIKIVCTQKSQGHLSNQTIATTTMNTLKRFDQAAATYYAAFHRKSL